MSEWNPPKDPLLVIVEAYCLAETRVFESTEVLLELGSGGNDARGSIAERELASHIYDSATHAVAYMSILRKFIDTPELTAQAEKMSDMQNAMRRIIRGLTVSDTLENLTRSASRDTQEHKP